MHASSNLKASEIVRSLQLPTGNHLDAYCHQLPRLSLPGSLSPYELKLLLRQFALIPTRYTAFASGRPNWLPSILSLLNDVSARRLASSYLKHADAVAVRSNRRGSLGHGRYLVFYLACGLAASVAHVMFNPTSIVPALGASGARRHSLVLHAPVSTCPDRRARSNPVHPPIHRGPRVCLWFLLQIFGAAAELLHASSSGGVAWWAHVGGFVAGSTLGPLLLRSDHVCYPDEGMFGFDTEGRRSYATGGFHVDR
jgi:hypothetical protein